MLPSYFIRYTYGLSFILLIVLLLTYIQAIWPFTIDDMYISVRYATQWLHHHQLTWNIGEAPVEGYSNFLFVCFAFILEYSGFDPIIGLKLIGVCSLFILGYLEYRLTRQWLNRFYAFLSMASLWLTRSEIIWSVSGLETTFYQCALTATILGCLHAIQTSQHRQRILYLSSLCLTITALTRPEGGFFIILLPAMLYIYTQEWRWSCCLLSMPMLCYVPYWIIRMIYFGHFFPNPIYCKGYVPMFTGFLLKQDGSLFIPLILASVPLLKSHSHRAGYFMLICPTILYSFLLWHADPIVAFEHRLFLPAFNLWLPLSFIGIHQLYTQKYKAYLTAILWMTFAIPTMSLRDYQTFAQNPMIGLNLRTDVSRWLTHHTKPGDHIVLADSGLIPYQQPNLAFIDAYCLNHPKMGHWPLAHREQLFCVETLKQHPQIIILTSLIERGQTQYPPADQCLLKTLTTRTDYRLAQTFTHTTSNHGQYRYEIFAYQSDAIKRPLVVYGSQKKRPNSLYKDL